MKIEMEDLEATTLFLIFGLIFIIFFWVPSCQKENDKDRKHERYIEELKHENLSNRQRQSVD